MTNYQIEEAVSAVFYKFLNECKYKDIVISQEMKGLLEYLEGDVQECIEQNFGAELEASYEAGYQDGYSEGYYEGGEDKYEEAFQAGYDQAVFDNNN